MNKTKDSAIHNGKLCSAIYKFLTYLAIFITVGVILSIIGYIVIKGIPELKPDLFEMKYTSDNGSMMPAIFNTIIMVILALLIAIPLGVGAAIYLCEYARMGSKFVKLVRLTSETLAGIPSIIFGLFGSLFFVRVCRLNLSMWSGSLTIAIMILPMIMRTSEEALLTVPMSYKMGSFGLGAGRLRTITKILLPSAMPGILAGVLLATGRIVGETVALLFTAGSVAEVALNLTKSGRTLAVHMYALSTEGMSIDKSYATAFVLLIIVLILNALSSLVAKKLTKE